MGVGGWLPGKGGGRKPGAGNWGEVPICSVSGQYPEECDADSCQCNCGIDDHCGSDMVPAGPAVGADEFHVASISGVSVRNLGSVGRGCAADSGFDVPITGLKEGSAPPQETELKARISFRISRLSQADCIEMC